MVAKEILPNMSTFECHWAIENYDQYNNEIGNWSCTFPFIISAGNFLLLIQSQQIILSHCIINATSSN
jgi:hypothetical protein